MDSTGGSNAAIRTDGRRVKSCINNINDGQGRISSLPDSILIHIFSFLPTKDAVKTMLLRRFGNLWTSIHSIDLDVRDAHVSEELDDPNAETLYIDFMRQVLLLHESPVIHKFRLEIDATLECTPNRTRRLRRRLAKDIDTWILFAVSRKVKVLYLNFGAVSERAKYMLPKCIFNCASLTKLKLYYCDTPLLVRVKNTSLRKLTLYEVKLSENLVEEILHGCPEFEHLSFHDCRGSNKFTLKSQSLKTLSILGMRKGVKLDMLCPSISVLDIRVCIQEYADAGDFPSLVETNFYVSYTKRHISDYE